MRYSGSLPRSPLRKTPLLGAAAGFLMVSCIASTERSVHGEADLIRNTERARLAALVAGDVATAAPFHADDFELINPYGGTATKDEYLEAVSSGTLDYLWWQSHEIAVRQDGRQAVIRYRSDLQVSFRGRTSPRMPHWHTDLYEKRGGRWQIVWSQATEIRD